MAEPATTLMKSRRRIASPQKAPDHANCMHDYSRDLRPAKWGSGVSLHGSNPEPPMSALGQKQTSAHVGVMSALPPKADIDRACRDIRFVPKADIRAAVPGPNQCFYRCGGLINQIDRT
jgi:hypothetical protein